MQTPFNLATDHLNMLSSAERQFEQEMSLLSAQITHTELTVRRQNNEYSLQMKCMWETLDETSHFMKRRVLLPTQTVRRVWYDGEDYGQNYQRSSWNYTHATLYLTRVGDKGREMQWEGDEWCEVEELYGDSP
jgi:hypothetical protein